MKIVFVNSCPYLGGAEQWHLRTATAFLDRGHQVAMMARPGPLAERARAAGLPVITLPMSFDLDLRSLAAAFFFFRRQRPDLILLNDQRECRVIAPAAALAGVPVRAQRKGWPFLKGSWRDRLIYGRAVTHVIANSEHIARIFRERSGLPEEKIKMIPNGVELESFPDADPELVVRKGFPEPCRVIGAAGRLVRQKGFLDLLEAAALLRRKKLAPYIMIAGEGGMKETIKLRASELGLSDRLILPGRIEDMPGFLSSLDVFAFPSYSEGRSNALAEALAAARPIAATDIPGNDELIKNNETGLLVPPKNPPALAEALQQLLTDRELASGLGRAGRAWAEQHLDSGLMLDEWEEHLHRLVSEARGGG